MAWSGSNFLSGDAIAAAATSYFYSSPPAAGAFEGWKSLKECHPIIDLNNFKGCCSLMLEKTRSQPFE
jgi:hypothetical protein